MTLHSQGCDIEKDALVLKAGDKIGSSEIGLLATVGVMTVKVYPTPVVAVLSTGDELVEPQTECLGRGQVLWNIMLRHFLVPFFYFSKNRIQHKIKE
ncbi:molybdopterin biosynthesis protein CNX1 [Cucumis melo var. makuwa]|uniref:Molybdopterin biosynthesis protein CNX1 n=1 Tax=Cucumis melo var. makuwa TaxID=1194695 RepID=A0A5A7UQE6_CUCMM|nr:molybdopterin biosynthesis protein CNX1 [Cucumis melo var. makuwa]